MKRRIAIASAVALGVGAFAVSALPAGAADSASVNLSIAVASPCILVSHDNVQFDPATFSPSVDSPTTSLAKSSYQVANCSQKSEPLFVKATDASGPNGAAWTLVNRTNIGVNQYGLEVDHQALSKVDQAVASGALLPSESRPTSQLLFMPLTGSDGAGQTMSLSITYTATF